jgi:hypothetical protein
MGEQIRFLLMFRSAEGERRARLVIESLRAFGGRLGDCPVWVFLPGAVGDLPALRGLGDVQCFPLAVEDRFSYYPFADKVYACARAEEMAGREVNSLIWLNLDCLIVNPPLLFDLATTFDAAFRPVHIRNIGSLAQEPLDEFWRPIYRTVGVADTPLTVESFVDAQRLRPYFNTHCFSIRPSTGVLRAWLGYFKALVVDREFQSGPCQDEQHQIFLHQAVLSALVTKSVDWERIRILPPEYSYPLHFQERVSPIHRSQTLNSLVCPVYEELDLHPDAPTGIQVLEPLQSWLIEHAPIQR